MAVSTHAPARGATGRICARGAPSLVSTHAPARGATEPYDVLARSGEVSTHAPARGATAQQSGECVAQESFNPRAREGRDVCKWGGIHGALLFQPTRPRGARLWAKLSDDGTHSFQPTRPRGARPLLANCMEFLRRFQPTRPRGARRTRY